MCAIGSVSTGCFHGRHCTLEARNSCSSQPLAVGRRTRVFPAKVQARLSSAWTEGRTLVPVWLGPSFASSVHERPESGVRGGERPRPVGPGNGPDHCARQLLNRGRRRGRPSRGRAARAPGRPPLAARPRPLLVCLLLYVYIYDNHLYRCALAGYLRGVQYSPPECGVPFAVTYVALWRLGGELLSGKQWPVRETCRRVFSPSV